MKHRILSLLLCVCMILPFLSLTGCDTKPTQPAYESISVHEVSQTEQPTTNLVTPQETDQTEQATEETTAEQKATLADQLFSEMTLEQKIGQMLMPDFREWEGEDVTELNSEIADAIVEYGFGGVILFAENTQGTAQTAQLVWDLQQTARIPMLISVDQEGGSITRLGTGTATIGNMALGATRSQTAARQIGEILGGELKSVGINTDFAPVLDVNNNPANPVIGVRSFSDNPEIVAVLGAAMIEGIHSQNVATAVKHFPGHGDTVTDSHSGLPSIDKSLSELEALELIPFQAGITAGTDIVMTAHIQYPQIESQTYRSKLDGTEITLPATLSKKLITDVLRNKLGFQGVVTTDAMNMQAIADHFDRLDAAKLAINAGVDILLMSISMVDAEGIAKCGEYIHSIAEMTDNGEISMDNINASVMRILTLKEKLGILDENSTTKDAQVAAALAAVGSAESHAVEWEIAKAAVTLVKNDTMLPLTPKDDDVTVLFCAYNDEIASIQYAIDLLKSEGKIPAEAEFAILCYNGRTALGERELDAISKADQVIASVETYLPGNITGGWQAAFLDDLIRHVHEEGSKIAILSIQLPYDVARYQNADAIAAVYCAKGMDEIPGDFDGEAATFGVNLPAGVYALLGGCEFTGTLPVNIPVLDEEYDFADEILYPRGYSCG